MCSYAWPLSFEDGRHWRKSIFFRRSPSKKKFIVSTFLCLPRKTTANAPWPMSSLGLYSKSPTVSMIEIKDFLLFWNFHFEPFQFWTRFFTLNFSSRANFNLLRSYDCLIMQVIILLQLQQSFSSWKLTINFKQFSLSRKLSVGQL